MPFYRFDSGPIHEGDIFESEAGNQWVAEHDRLEPTRAGWWPVQLRRLPPADMVDDPTWLIHPIDHAR